MLYELFFHTRQQTIPSEESVAEHFAAIPYCSIALRDGDEPGLSVSYENLATGVSFSFFFERDCDAQADYTPPEYTFPGLSFRMNVGGRPVFFAMEAMPIVAAFCRRFGLMVDDPQQETFGPPDEQELIRSWMEHNLAMLSELEGYEVLELAYAPMEKAIQWWRYTYQEGSFVRSLKDDLPAPSIFWSRDDSGGSVTMMRWEEGGAMLFPRCDYIHIHVEDSAALGLAGRVDGLALYDEVIAVLGPHLADHETPLGLIPALNAGTDAPLGRIIGQCRVVSPERFYAGAIEPSVLCPVDIFAAGGDAEL